MPHISALSIQLPLALLGRFPTSLAVTSTYHGAGSLAMVLKRLLGSRRERRPFRHSTPDRQRIYAVGDIHGRLDLLEEVLQRIRADDASRQPAEMTLIFLGDLVDRGPDSAGVIDRLMRLEEESVSAKFILGNHDEVFLKAASGDLKALRFLINIGGKETILSYGISEEECKEAEFEELADLLAAAVPKKHLEFLRSFSDFERIGGYFFVHAGVRPGVPLEEQRSSDLRWIRSEFLSSKQDHGLMVVHGHSICGEARVLRNRIGIDTGAFASGRLTALGLEGNEQWFITAEGVPNPAWQGLTD